MKTIKLYINLTTGLIVFIALISSLILCIGCTAETETITNPSNEAISYVITFVDESGKTLAKQDAKYNADSWINVVKFSYAPEGYNNTYFTSDGKQVYSNEFYSKSDVTITVKSVAITYTVTFARGSYYSSASGTLPEKMTCTYDVEYTMPENNLTYTSYDTTYKTAGWTKNEYYSSKKGEYSSGCTFKNLTTTDGAYVTLYTAFSNSDGYELTFYKDETTTYYHDDYYTVYADAGDLIPANSVPVVSKDYCKFDGWYVSTDMEKNIIDFTKYDITKDESFRPKFSLLTYTVKFETDHGTAPQDIIYSYGTSTISLTTGEYVLSVEGYTFGGWYESGVDYSTSAIYSSTSGNINLTAKWTPWTAKLTFDNNEPSRSSYGGSMYSQSVTYNTAIALKSNSYYVSGYSFAGWNTKADGTGTSYANIATYTWLGSANNETITLYAQWKQNQTSIAINILSPGTESDISLSYDSTTTSFKATLAGADTFTWYIDGVKVSGESGAQISAYLLPEGTHSIMVTTVLNGNTYSATETVNVTKSAN